MNPRGEWNQDLADHKRVNGGEGVTALAKESPGVQFCFPQAS